MQLRARIRCFSLPTLELIAEQVGFASQSSLTHAFQRFYAQTPGQVRRLQ